MKKTIVMTTLFALSFALSACNKSADEPMAEAPATEMGSMSTTAETKLARGAGTVTAIDKSAAKITINHGPIAELQWPAMKMGFDSKPELLSTVAVGDRVEFDLTVIGTASEVTAIKKQ